MESLASARRHAAPSTAGAVVSMPHRPMRVLERSVYRGPNLFSMTPMVRIQLDLGSLEDWPTDRLAGFVDALLAALPGLADHGCSRPDQGGLVERMREGTWLGHVAEHVALELQRLAGVDVTRGKTRSVRGKPGVYNVLFAYRDEETALLAGALALRLVEGLLPETLRGIEGLDLLVRRAPKRFDASAAVVELKAAHERSRLGPTTQSLIGEAERRGIPVLRRDDQSLVQLGYGSRQKRIRASITSDTSQIAVETASDKDLTKSLLEAAGLPVPRGVVVRDADEAARGDVIIDQHFAERGRIGRLLGAVAQNPRVLGIGIDEDTAVVVEGGRFDVLGSGAVYVVDGAGVTHSNIAEAEPQRTLSMYDVRVHVLSRGDGFDLERRRPEASRLSDSVALEQRD